MKKIIIVLSLFAFLLSPVYAQTPQAGLTAEAKTALIVKLKAKLADLMNQLDLLKAQLSQQQHAEDFTRPIEAPSPTNLRRLVAMCSLSEDLTNLCTADDFVTGYFTNIPFRTLMDILMKKAEQKLAEQKTQNELAQQRYLLYLQTINQPAIPPTSRHEVYSLPVYSGGLKQLETPRLNSPIRWTIQWTGDGGGFITTNGSTDPINTTHFQCITGKCFSL